MDSQIVTFRQALERSVSQMRAANVFCGHGYDSIEDEAVALVLAAAQLSPDLGAEVLDDPLPAGALEQLGSFLQERCELRRPVAYITGEAWLAGRRFVADERALIPRSPIAEVVCNECAPWWPSAVTPRVIADVCCGGGSLGILAAETFPDSQVVLMDLDADALALAHLNAQHSAAAGRLWCIRADLLTALPDSCVDLLLANPPYVSEEEMRDLPAEYAHEPRLALEADENGVAIVRRLFHQASRVLSPSGLLILEVGETQETLEAAFPRASFMWIELCFGGRGVMALSANELQDWCRVGIL